MPSKKNPNKDTTPEVEPAPAPPADEAAQVPATATPTNTATHFTRGVIAAGAAGLLVAGGLAGFGIGRATGDDNGPQFNRSGQMRPGHHGPDRDGRRGGFDRGQRDSRSQSGQDAPEDSVTPAPSGNDSSSSGT